MPQSLYIKLGWGREVQLQKHSFEQTIISILSDTQSIGFLVEHHKRLWPRLCQVQKYLLDQENSFNDDSEFIIAQKQHRWKSEAPAKGTHETIIAPNPHKHNPNTHHVRGAQNQQHCTWPTEIRATCTQCGGTHKQQHRSSHLMVRSLPTQICHTTATHKNSASDPHNAQRAHCDAHTHTHPHKKTYIYAYIACLLQITINNKFKKKKGKAHLFEVNSPPAGHIKLP